MRKLTTNCPNAGLENCFTFIFCWQADVLYVLYHMISQYYSSATRWQSRSLKNNNELEIGLLDYTLMVIQPRCIGEVLKHKTLVLKY